VRDGFGAQAAVTAAWLARRGLRSYDRSIEGPEGLYALYAGGRYDPQRLLQGLGEVYEGEHLSFKPWPSCRGTHAFIEAAILLRERHGVDPDAIEQVHASVSDMFGVLCEPFAQKCRPATANDAKFSVPFTVAAALVHGRVGLAEFMPAGLADARVRDLAGRVRCEVRAPAAGDALRGALTIRLRDGREWHCAVDAPLGSPARPMSDAALRRKFADCVRYAARPLGEAEVAQIADAVAGMDAAGDLGPLLRA
jgi:2-methylcitrate dehydratase PrpD